MLFTFMAFFYEVTRTTVNLTLKVYSKSPSEIAGLTLTSPLGIHTVNFWEKLVKILRQGENSIYSNHSYVLYDIAIFCFEILYQKYLQLYS